MNIMLLAYKIITKNIETINWSYSDVYNSLDKFVNEMNTLGNKKWSEIKPDDVVNYRIHIPYNVIPKEYW